MSDPDNDNYTLSLSGADQAQFNLSQSGLLTVATGAQIDYERKSQLSLEITATENRNDNRTVLHSAASITINVQDLPEPSGEYALSFDGSDDKVSIPFSQTLLNDNITISAWVKPDELSQDLYTVVGFREAFNLKLQKSGDTYKISVHIKTNESWLWDFSTKVVRKMESHCGTYDGNTVKLYLNGKYDGSFIKSGNLNTYQELSIRSRDQMKRYFHGIIDDVQIWKRY